MFEHFQENHSPDEMRQHEFESPSTSDLKSQLADLFPIDSQEGVEIRPNILDDNPFEKAESSSVTLDDGTVIRLPKTTDGKQKVDGDDVKSSDISQNELKPTRELTEDEKAHLKETLGWTDKQISKCTIDEDGVIHYRTDREDMEGKTGENGVTYERKTVDIHGVKVQGVFPVFESVCEVQLPEDLEKTSNARQFKECNRQLKENIDNDPELRDSFSDEQLEEIEDGDTPTGYVWHHNEETGKMQLVKVEDHDRTQGGAAHTGGKALWGGSYSSHETPASDTTNETDQPTSSKEET